MTAFPAHGTLSPHFIATEDGRLFHLTAHAPGSVIVRPPYRLTDALMDLWPDTPPRPREPAFLGELLTRPLPDGDDPPPSERPLPAGWQAHTYTVANTDLGMVPQPYVAGPITRATHDERAAFREKRRAEVAEAWRRFDYAAEHVPLRLPGSPSGRIVTALWREHAPEGDDRPYCGACHDSWPCSTARTIGEGLDVPMPDPWDLDEREPTDEDLDDEEFCPHCLAGVESPEHREKCGEAP